ncbi:MAG: macro domain-containing protein, partial [Nitrosarchaeum sp.]|nr:macro domain-containing protein [Nitrosarchaeum sp.]
KGDLLKQITNEKLDGIMSAANGRGPMGRGIAGAIKRMGGDIIQEDAFRVCLAQDPQPGQAYSTIAGSFTDQGIKRIIHAVTMKQPGGPTSLEVISNAFKAALELAQKEGITKIGCTALGTGVGELNDKEVAKYMFDIAKSSPISIVFYDYHDDFVNTLQELITA